MNRDEQRLIENIADLRVRKYFDHYLENILPKILEQAVVLHNQDPIAHGGVERRSLSGRDLGRGVDGGTSDEPRRRVLAIDGSTAESCLLRTLRISGAY